MKSLKKRFLLVNMRQVKFLLILYAKQNNSDPKAVACDHKILLSGARLGCQSQPQSQESNQLMVIGRRVVAYSRPRNSHKGRKSGIFTMKSEQCAGHDSQYSIDVRQIQ